MPGTFQLEIGKQLGSVDRMDHIDSFVFYPSHYLIAGRQNEPKNPCGLRGLRGSNTKIYQRHLYRFNLHGTNLEFRNLGNRVQCRNGQIVDVLRSRIMEIAEDKSLANAIRYKRAHDHFPAA